MGLKMAESGMCECENSIDSALETEMAFKKNIVPVNTGITKVFNVRC